MKFAITAYGSYLVNYLYVFLQSFKDAYDEPPEVVLYYCDLKGEVIDQIKQKAPFVELKEVPEYMDIAREKSTRQRFPRKVEIWYRQLLDIYSDKIIFMDIDMLVLKPFEHFLTNDFDFGYCYRDKLKAINAGVMLVNKNEKTVEFFKKMRDYVVKWVHDERMVAKTKAEWGGMEQGFLGRYLSRADHSTDLKKEGTIFRGFHIDLFNRARAESIKGAYALHYPGGWRFIFGNDMRENYSEKRKKFYKTHYKPMRKIWERTLEKWETAKK